MSARMLIFGAGGFIGKSLRRHFLSDGGYEVTAYSSHECNLLSTGQVEACLSGLTAGDVVILAAAVTRLRDNSYESMLSNIRMAENVAQVLRKKAAGQMVFFSTIDVYGLIQRGTVIDERLLPCPDDYYAVSKLTSEFILKSACSASGTPLFILRLSGVYGPDDRGSTLSKLVESAMHKKVILYGDGSDKRDFVHVADICSLIEAGIKKKTDMLINVASGKSFSISEIVDMIRSCGIEFNVAMDPAGDAAKKRAGDLIFDVSLMKEKFPEIHMRDVREGLQGYIRGLTENGGWHV